MRKRSLEVSAEDAAAKLLAATAEARETIRELHGARKDLRTEFAAMKHWLADEETGRAFRGACADMRQWVSDELTRLMKADAATALTQLNSEVEQLVLMYAKKLEDTFDRIAQRMEMEVQEIPPDLAQDLLRTLLLATEQEGKGVKPA